MAAPVFVVGSLLQSQQAIRIVDRYKNERVVSVLAVATLPVTVDFNLPGERAI